MPRMSGLPRKSEPWTRAMTNFFRGLLNELCRSESNPEATTRILKTMQEAFEGQTITRCQVAPRVRRFRLNGVRKGTLWTAEMNIHFEALEPCRENETLVQATTRILKAMERHKITQSQDWNRVNRFRLNGGHEATPWTDDMTECLLRLKEATLANESQSDARKRIHEAMQEEFSSHTVTYWQVARRLRALQHDGPLQGRAWTQDDGALQRPTAPDGGGDAR